MMTKYAGLNSSTTNRESLWVKINLDFQRETVIGAVYRPPSGKVSECINELNSALDIINPSRNKDVFILGDLNLNHFKNDKNYGDLKSAMGIFGLSQKIEVATHYGDNENMLIDVIYTNSQIVPKTGTLKWNISDHEVIYCTRKKTRRNLPSAKIMVRSYRNYNRANFMADIANAKWAAFDNEPMANGKWLLATDLYRYILDKSCPVHEFKVKKSDYPWISSELLERINDKHVLHQVQWKTWL